MNTRKSDYRIARARGKEEKQNFAEDLDFDGKRILIKLRSGESFPFFVKDAAVLANASQHDLERMELISKGAALWFPSLNVTFYVPALVRGKFGPAQGS